MLFIVAVPWLSPKQEAEPSQTGSGGHWCGLSAQVRPPVTLDAESSNPFYSDQKSLREQREVSSHSEPGTRGHPRSPWGRGVCEMICLHSCL